MKYVTIFFGTIILFVFSNTKEVTSIDENVTSNITLAVFDGFEGDSYFFTNNEDKAITITDDKKILFKNYSTNVNAYVGKTFEIIVKPNEMKNNVCNSKDVIALNIKK